MYREVKKIIFLILLVIAMPVFAEDPLTTAQGGTGTSSPSGILYGIGDVDPLQTVTIGSGLDFTAGVLSFDATTAPFYALDVAGYINTDIYSGYKQGGYTILYASTTKTSIAVGKGAMNATFTGAGNTAVGNSALTAVTSGNNNVAVGSNSLGTATSSGYSMGIGTSALYSQIDRSGHQSYNTAVGHFALTNNNYGYQNTAIGYGASQNNTTGVGNVGVGSFANYFTQTGSYNTAVGEHTLVGVSGNSFSGNTAVGYYIGPSLTTGSYNTLLGMYAGYNIVSGSSNIVIGQYLNLPSTTASGQLNIGNVLYGTGMYSAQSPSSVPTANGKIGIGTTTPATALDVNGTITQTTVKNCTLGLTTNALGSITGCVTSDGELKKNIKPLEDGSVVLKLRPITYDWKDPTDKDGRNHAGFDAREVQVVMPTAVTISYINGVKRLAVDPNAIAAAITKEVQTIFVSLQTLVARVTGLEERINNQEVRIRALEKQIQALGRKN